MRFKSLYKVCILGSPAAVVWEVPSVHRAFFFLILEHVVCSLISSLKKKYQKRQLETTSCLCSIATYVGASVSIWKPSVRALMFQRQEILLQRRKSHFFIDIPDHSRECLLLDLAPLTAAVDDPDSLLPPAIRLRERRVSATSRIICLMLWLCSTDLWKPVNCARQPGKLNVRLSGSARSDRC